MKKLLLLVIISVCDQLHAQIVNIPDPVFKQALLEHGQNGNTEIDTNFDGEIQVSEAQALTGLLNVNGQFIDIHDLTGIEAFVNITDLNVILNQLTTLDLSNNTALQSLGCSDNQLTYLNIEQCTDLEILSCHTNQLSELDLSNLPLLNTLRCYNNQLTALNVSENPQLNILRSQNNLVSYIDLSQNPNLSSITLANNNLEFLDIRNGNNQSILGFSADDNPNLKCIFVDDATYMETNFEEYIDPNSTFVETQTECDALGVTDNELENIQIYPNPVTDILHIKSSPEFGIQNSALVITDMLGRTVYNTTVSKNTAELHFSTLKEGMYFLTLYKNNKILLTIKISKL